MQHVIVHISTVDPQAKTMPADEWCLTKIIQLPVTPLVGDRIKLPEFEGWFRKGLLQGPVVEERGMDDSFLSIYLNVRYMVQDLMGFRAHLVDRGWRRCGGGGNPTYPVQWHCICEGYPEIGETLVCSRGGGKSFEVYHGKEVGWSGSVVDPDFWAYWTYDMDLRDAFSIVRFDTLQGVPDPVRPKGV